MIELNNISKSFIQANTKIPVLSNLSISINKGEKIAIIGPSGSGKSTLLSIMSGMDKPNIGDVILDNQNIVDLPESDLCDLRNKKIGIVFQAFELIPSFSALENVLLPLDIANKANINKVKSLLTDLGLKDRMNHLPKILSGGEQQRVAIARAIINDPQIIFADEPTGNLDRKTGDSVIEILLRLVSEQEKTLVLITHDLNLSRKMDKVYKLENGQLNEFLYK